MKNLFAAFAGFVLLVASATALALQAGGYRLTMTGSVDGDTPISITEVEFLSASSDVFEADLGYSICGWDRVIASGTYAGTYQVGCDTFSTNRLGDPNVTIAIPSDWRTAIKTRRQIYTMLDNNFNTYWTTADKVTADDPYSIQYTIHTGNDVPARTLPSVTAYAITIPVADLSTGAPIAWTVEYFDAAVGNWLQDSVVTSDDVNWSSAASVWKTTPDFNYVDISSTITGTDTSGNTLQYVVGAVEVVLTEPGTSPVTLVDGTDYTATDGTTITLTTPPATGSTLSVTSTLYYLVDGSTYKLWNGTDWGSALGSAAVTTAKTRISDGARLGYRLEFDL